MCFHFFSYLFIFSATYFLDGILVAKFHDLTLTKKNISFGKT
jgi:hypothetical protein